MTGVFIRKEKGFWTQEEGHVKGEAETGGMWPPRSTEAGREAGDRFSLGAFGRSPPRPHFDFRLLASRTVTQHISASSHQGPQEAPTHRSRLEGRAGVSARRARGWMQPRTPRAGSRGPAGAHPQTTRVERERNAVAEAQLLLSSPLRLLLLIIKELL